MKQYVNLPNCITASRIIGAVILLFTERFSIPFFIIYTLCGITDAIDGFVARVTKKNSEFGAKLDSVSDLVFYAVLLFKIFPFLWAELEMYIWYITLAAIIVRICSYITAIVKYKKFASLHTYANKLTGAAIFCVPYLVKFFDTISVCLVVSIIALVASVEEFVIHIKAKDYSGDKHSIFSK